MVPDRVHVLDDAQAAVWMVRRLLAGSVAGARDGSEPQRVGDLVPTGYPAYARVLHPVLGGADEETWADVAELRGCELGPWTAWSDLAGPGTGEPTVGSLSPEHLAALCDVLAEHTVTPGECTFALDPSWPAVPASGRTGTLVLGGRGHVLVGGPLSSAVPLSFSDAPGQWWAQSPTVWWPQDRGWCVTTAPDRRCTLVGGSVALVEDLLAAAALEVWPVDVDDRLPAA
jgi:hypothetical protein